MRKAILLTILITLLVKCSKTETDYVTHGYYYTNGTVVTEDGNEWEYSTREISQRKPFDNMPIWVIFSDNGTPDNIYDDIIKGVIFDRETHTYDELEQEFKTNANWEVIRKGNRIHISIKTN